MKFQLTATVSLLATAVSGATIPTAVEVRAPASVIDARAPVDTSPVTAAVEALADGATPYKVTWFMPGLGACGFWSGAGEYVVALDRIIYEAFTPGGAAGNPNKMLLCGWKVRVTYNGRSIDATIADKCGTGCAFRELDLSLPAFSALQNPADGRFWGTWVLLP